MNNTEAGLLVEVAAELVSKQIADPTAQQIADAMLARINRQGELYERLFGVNYKGQVANGTRAFVADMASTVYARVRS